MSLSPAGGLVGALRTRMRIGGGGAANVVLPLQGPLSDPQLLAQPARLSATLDQLRDEYLSLIHI